MTYYYEFIDAGPRWLPLLGCFLRFLEIRKKIGYNHLAFHELSKIYGPVLGMKFGKQKFVIISTHDLVKKVLLQEDFNGRPDGFFYRLRACGERKGKQLLNSLYFLKIFLIQVTSSQDHSLSLQHKFKNCFFLKKTIINKIY